MEDSILQVLQGLFSAFPKGESAFHYDDIDDESEILIEGQSTENLRTVSNSKPKIVVARGSVSVRPMSMGSNMIGSANLSRLNQRITVMRSGTVGISCFSRNDLEADRIAELCADAIESLSDVIRQFGFLQLHTATIGQRAMIKADAKAELFVTPVLLKVDITKNYRVQVTDPSLLRRVVHEYLIKPVNVIVKET